MKNSIRERAEGYTKKGLFKKRWHRVVMTLAVCVVFCTTYALILPAITLHNEGPMCGMEEHCHNAACYQTAENTYFACQTQLHAHEDACYSEEGILTCGVSDFFVHDHADMCYAEDGSLICPLIEAQEHIHSQSCYEESAVHEHTQECFAVVPEALICADETHEHVDACYTWIETTVCATETVTDPICGIKELVLHTHEAACFDETGRTICGMTELVRHVHSEECKNMVCALAEHTHNDDCIPVYEKSLLWENEFFEICVTTNSETAIPMGTQLKLQLVEEGEMHDAYMNWAKEHAEGTLDGVFVFNVAFTLGEEEIDLPDAKTKVVVKVKEAEDKALLSEADVQETLTTYQALQSDGEQIFAGASVSLDAMYEDITLETTKDMSFALLNTSQALPKFEVQYFANMLRYAGESTTNYIPIINTVSTLLPGEKTDGSGGVLPVNGRGTSASPTAQGIYNLALEDQGNGLYKIAMGLTPVEIYEHKENVVYSNLLTINHLDILHENDNYYLDFIRTQSAEQKQSQAEAGITGLDERYWTKHVAQGGLDIHDSYYFTNNKDAGIVDGKHPILIEEDTTVRFVYYPTESTKQVPSNFYDYDISNGNHTYSGTQTIMNTGKQGINSHEDNDLTTAHLAFGNRNTGTGYGDVTWYEDGVINTPNKYNSQSFMGCTFGIAEGYDYANKRLIYSPTIQAPCYFGHDLNVVGKTAYMYADENSGTTMNFTRYGDTYTLTSISGSQGISANNLNVLTGRTFDTKVIYSNDFWPFDGVKNRDIYFGNTGDFNAGNLRYTGYGEGALPLSDDGLNHNSYFGLQFSIDFHLDGSYDGPLEYLFYGDDDMWVFLTDHTTGQTRLICDIGGVHSSVGSYTDLWDWVPNTEERHLGVGDYTLTFFYTERGASGSSCFMQFTIPDTIGVPIVEGDTGTVKIEKKVEKGDFERAYNFDYQVEVENGIYLPYHVYDSTTNELLYEGSTLNIGSFELKHGQYILLQDIPLHTKVTVQEKEDGYTTIWTIPDEAMEIAGVVTVTLDDTETVELLCTNTLHYKLPNTGGSGTEGFIRIGILLMALAGILLLCNHRRKRV